MTGTVRPIINDHPELNRSKVPLSSTKREHHTHDQANSFDELRIRRNHFKEYDEGNLFIDRRVQIRMLKRSYQQPDQHLDLATYFVGREIGPNSN